MSQIRILLADDNLLVREGLHRILEHEEGFECVAVAADGDQAVKIALKEQPDVVILDVSMPNLDGIEATKQIHSNCPNTAILIVSAFDYEHYILSCIRAGASGYLLKDNLSGQGLVNAIHTLMTGENVYDRKIHGVMYRLATQKGKGRGGGIADDLSEREFEVLKLVARGMSNKEISSELYISDQTVGVHVSSILAKLHVRSRVGAVLCALVKGLLRTHNLRPYSDSLE